MSDEVSVFKTARLNAGCLVILCLTGSYYHGRPTDERTVEPEVGSEVYIVVRFTRVSHHALKDF